MRFQFFSKGNCSPLVDVYAASSSPAERHAWNNTRCASSFSLNTGKGGKQQKVHETCILSFEKKKKQHKHNIIYSLLCLVIYIIHQQLAAKRIPCI